MSNSVNGLPISQLDDLADVSTDAPADGNALVWVADTNKWTPTPIEAGGVSSVFGRTGDVVAEAGDYDVSQVTGAMPLTGDSTITGHVIIQGDTINPQLTVCSSGAGLNDSCVAWLIDTENVIHLVTRFGGAGAHPWLTVGLTSRVATFNFSPVAPTPTAGDNSTQLATTAFTTTAVAALSTTVTTALALKADDSNTVHKTGAAQTVSADTLFGGTLTVASRMGVTTASPQVPIDLGSVATQKFKLLLYGQGGSDGFQSGLGVNTGTLLNAMTFFLGASANFSIDVANVSEAFPYPSGLTSKLSFVGSTGNLGVFGALTPGVVADALIPNGGIAWSSTTANVLKCRTPAGTAQTLVTTTAGKATIDARDGKIAANTDASTVTFNCGTSDRHALTLGGNRTLALTGDTVGQQFTLILTQDATGSRTVTWWSGIKWPGGTVPTLTTTASKTDVFTFLKLASGSYLGFVAGQNI